MVKTAGFEKYFRVISYLVAFCGLFALFASGGVGILVFTGFLLAFLLAWFLEDTKWQLTERLAVAIVAFSIVGFFFDWKLGITGTFSSGFFATLGLSRLILFLSAVKLLQKKVDKDWIFIYIIAFFEILLAAGLSISPMYLFSFLSFLFFSTCAIIAFEIRKSSRGEPSARDNKNKTGIRRLIPKIPKKVESPKTRLPAISVVLLAGITIIGLPVFFMLPRGNAAGFGGDLSSSVNVTGFSDSVTLGTIGTLQKNDAIVMRVRIDQNNNKELNRLLWRGVALDRFDNLKWTKSQPQYRRPFAKNEKNLVIFDYPSRNRGVTIQTFYLEPLNTNVLFALKRPFALLGVDLVNRDAEDALLGFRGGTERTSYSVYSDTSVPEVSELRSDNTDYKASYHRYLQVPDDLDPRISALAVSYIEESGATNRHDIAEIIEARLQDDFGYSLDMKASGDQPIADFLFNVKTGHCEYFASAMVMMLRTQGIAARIVNGFQSGDYNTTAGVYVVRQQNAHSWVEVYFPSTNSWVAFNPTPPDGLSGSSNRGFFGVVSGYLEALETFWIQYVVAYDGQEQRSLFRSFRDSVRGYASSSSNYLDSAQSSLNDWWKDLTGDEGVAAGFRAAGIGLGILFGVGLLIFGAVRLWRVVSKLGPVRWLMNRLRPVDAENRVVFYEKMQRILARRGLRRERSQTPVEFAASVGIEEVETVTEKYNRVRFGGYRPGPEESHAIEKALEIIKQKAVSTGMKTVRNR